MKDFIIKSSIYKLFSFNSLLNLSKQKLVFPFYHTVSDVQLPHIKHVYPVKSKTSFISDLEFLLKHFVPIDPKDLNQILNDRNDGKKYMLLTFDDGLKEVYDIILPILKSYSIPAIFFLNTAFIDNKKMFFRYKVSLLIDHIENYGIADQQRKSILNILKRNDIKTDNLKHGLSAIKYLDSEIVDIIAELLEYDFKTFLENERPYLTTDQVNEILRQGYHIGSHSVDHPNYSEIEFNDQVAQTSESLRFLKSKFNTIEQYFSFPFTDFGVSSEFFDRIYSNAAMSLNYTFGTAGIKNDIHVNHLQRISMEKSIYSAKQLLKAEVLYYLLKAPFGLNNIKRD